MAKILFSFVVLAFLVAVQPAAAQDAAPMTPADNDLEMFQLLQLDFAPAPMALDGAATPRSHCPANYCTLGKQECAADCAPGIGTGACFHQFCEVVCFCSG